MDETTQEETEFRQSLLTRAATLTKSQAKLSARTVFATWPRNGADPQEVLDRVVSFFGERLGWAVVAREEHADADTEGASGLHLHAVLQLKSRRTIWHRVLDEIGGRHGNYQSARYPRRCVEYTIKNGEWKAHGFDPEEYIRPKRTRQHYPDNRERKSSLIAQMLRDGSSMNEVNDEDPGYVMMHLQSLQRYQAFIELEKLRKSERQHWDILAIDGLTEQDRTIAEWLNTNMGQPRAHRQKQLYIWGPPEVGKTHLTLQLEKFWRVYRVPIGEEFVDGYQDDLYDLAVIDEFCGSMSLRWMNTWLEGSPCTLRRKGSQVLKAQNIPTIVLSNVAPHQCYPRAAEARVDAFASRLLIVHAQEQIRIL